MRGFIFKFKIGENKLEQLGLTIQSIRVKYGMRSAANMTYEMEPLINDISSAPQSEYLIFSKLALPSGLAVNSSIKCKFSITLANSEGKTKVFHYKLKNVQLRKKTDGELIDLPIDHPLANPELAGDDLNLPIQILALIDPDPPAYAPSTDFDMTDTMHLTGTIEVRVWKTTSDQQTLHRVYGIKGERGSAGKVIFNTPIILQVGAMYAYYDNKGYSSDQKGWVTLAESTTLPYSNGYDTNQMYVYSNHVEYNGIHLQHTGTRFVHIETGVQTWNGATWNGLQNYTNASRQNEPLKNGHARWTVVERVVDEPGSTYYGQTVKDVLWEYYEGSYDRTTTELVESPGQLLLWQYASRLGTNMDANIAKLQEPSVAASYYMQSSTHYDYTQSFSIRRLQ